MIGIDMLLAQSLKLLEQDIDFCLKVKVFDLLSRLVGFHV
jgi:hypothetical protein